MSSIRVGLIGYGGWTRLAFVPALRQHDRVRIVSAAAFSENSQDRIREELGPDVAVYGGFEALLDGPALDAVMMAIPDAIHEAAMNAVLDAGVAAYYEPPLAGSPDGIRRILKRLVAAGQVTHGDLEIGYASVVLRAAELLRQGAIGVPQTVHLKLRSNWAAFGGPDLCLAHHLGPWYVDGLNTIIGRPPGRVFVMDGHGQPGRRQFHSLVQFDYGGLWGTIHLNIDSVDTLETTIEVTGDEGDLSVDYFRNTIRLRTKSECRYRWRRRWRNDPRRAGDAGRGRLARRGGERRRVPGRGREGHAEPYRRQDGRAALSHGAGHRTVEGRGRLGRNRRRGRAVIITRDGAVTRAGAITRPAS